VTRETSPAPTVQVALPVPLPRFFTYLAEPDAPPSAGDLVEAPFGGRRRLVGLVTSVDAAGGRPEGLDDAQLKKVSRVLPPEYRIRGARRRLADWLASYYALPLGEVVPLFHPPLPGTQMRAQRSESPAYPTVDAPILSLTPAQ
jgi:primosomal protein N' (replication factor Y)